MKSVIASADRKLAVAVSDSDDFTLSMEPCDE